LGTWDWVTDVGGLAAEKARVKESERMMMQRIAPPTPSIRPSIRDVRDMAAIVQLAGCG